MSALVQSKEALHFKIKYVPHFNQGHISFSREAGLPPIQRHHGTITFIISGLKEKYSGAAHSGLTVDVFSLHQRAGEGEVHLLD